MQISVIVLCIYLLYIISYAILNKIPYLTTGHLMRTQFWICIYFIVVFFIEFFRAGKNKWNYFLKHFIFLLISIPYLNILSFLSTPTDISFWDRLFMFGDISKLGMSEQSLAFLKYVPLVRGGYALSFVVAWISRSRINSLFLSYLFILFSTIYFASLIFFEIEYGVNNMVHRYSDAAWWAFMDATTVGSNIYAVTPVGKILSVLLAALGMCMFPIFTVYITSIVGKKERKQHAAAQPHPATSQSPASVPEATGTSSLETTSVSAGEKP